MSVEWSLEGGGDARLVRLDGERASVDSSRPHPIGSTLVGRQLPSGSRHEFKVRGCRRREDGRFLVEGRFVNLSRRAREQLLLDARS